MFEELMSDGKVNQGQWWINEILNLRFLQCLVEWRIFYLKMSALKKRKSLRTLESDAFC